MSKPQTDLAAWLLEQIAEDERVAQSALVPDEMHAYGDPRYPLMSPEEVPHAMRGYLGGTWGEHAARWDMTRVLAECEAKRAIVEWHQNWPVLVTTEPTLDRADPTDLTNVTYRMTQQINWLTTREYVERFGADPPSTPILRALAAPYRDRPGWRDEWATT